MALIGGAASGPLEMGRTGSTIFFFFLPTHFLLGFYRVYRSDGPDGVSIDARFFVWLFGFFVLPTPLCGCFFVPNFLSGFFFIHLCCCCFFSIFFSFFLPILYFFFEQPPALVGPLHIPEHHQQGMS